MKNQGPINDHQFYLLFLSCSSNLPIESILSVISRSKYCSLSLSFLCSFWISESAWFRCASSVSFCSMNSVCWARMVSSCWILSSSWRFDAMKDSRSAKSSSRSDSSCWLHVGFDLFQIFNAIQWVKSTQKRLVCKSNYKDNAFNLYVYHDSK